MTADCDGLLTVRTVVDARLPPCGSVINRPWTGTIPWPGGSEKIFKG